MPFGPKVLFTKSPMAMAPMKDDLKKKERKIRKGGQDLPSQRKGQFCRVQEAERAYQASGLCSLFISSGLEDVHRREGKGRLNGETETRRLNARTLPKAPR